MGRVQEHMGLLLLASLVSTIYCMDVRNGEGDIIRDLPCVKRLNQLFCGSPGVSYPSTMINGFITDNKALLRRMYGELQEPQKVTITTVRVVRTFKPLVLKPQFASPPEKFNRFRRDVLEGTLEEMMFKDDLDLEEEDEEDLYSLGKSSNKTESERVKRQAEFPGNPEIDNGKADVCESKIEITTPYWASNSNGKVRAILNNEQFEQAIHQEICTKSSTVRCNRDCACEQKYKWHRLLAYDPNNDCAGIFMDWFLYPSCCVCRCNKNPFLT